MRIDSLSELGYEEGADGKARKITRAGTIKAAKKRRDNPEDFLSAALNVLLFGLEDPRSGVMLLEPGVKFRGQALHVANERASKAETKRLKWVGVKPGVADWIFTGPPLVAIELKWGKNKATQKQLEWGEGLEAGWDLIGLTEDDMEGAGPVTLDLLKRLFAPRYWICTTLADAVGVLFDADLILEPETLEDVGKAVDGVRAYWLLRYGMEIR